MKIRLGPAGNCILSKGEDTLDSLRNLKKNGLDAQEIEFVRSVYMNNNYAKRVGELAKNLDIKLSVHAPYYINLASKEKPKIHASKKRILDSCERADLMGAKYVVFHPAYFGGMEKEKVYHIVLEHMKDMQSTIEKKKWDVFLAPETTGKHSALGSLDETLRLAKETGTKFCIDSAHLWARLQGGLDFKEMFEKLKKTKEKFYHFHFSGIEYTMKGEKNHVNLGENGPDFKEFAKELLKTKIDSTIICESPVTWRDSLKMKKILEKMGYRF